VVKANQLSPDDHKGHRHALGVSGQNRHETDLGSEAMSCNAFRWWGKARPDPGVHGAAAFHPLPLRDLGKFAESFHSQCPDVFMALRGRSPDPAKPYTLRHDSLGMLFWTEVLRDRVIDQAWFGENSDELANGLDCWARACTGHHGQPPTEGDHWGQHFDRREDRAAALDFAEAMRAGPAHGAATPNLALRLHPIARRCLRVMPMQNHRIE
jgi:HD domain